MNDFAGDLKRFSVKCEEKTTGVFADIVDMAHESIQVGSPITGSPGQPVRTGALRNSWQKFFESPTVAVISTDLVYAQPIEDGVGRFGPLHLHSSVGGFHSVALTIAAFKRIAEIAIARAAGK